MSDRFGWAVLGFCAAYPAIHCVAAAVRNADAFLFLVGLALLALVGFAFRKAVKPIVEGPRALVSDPSTTGLPRSTTGDPTPGS